jgi:hypothetical protein
MDSIKKIKMEKLSWVLGQLSGQPGLFDLDRVNHILKYKIDLL